MSYDAIIFDLDGTLWDANISCTKAWNRLLENLKYDGHITNQGMNSVTGKPMDDCIDILLPGIKNKYPDIKQLLTNFEKEEINANGAFIYQDVPDKIKDLSKYYKVFIVSNCQEWYLMKFIELSGLFPYLSGWDCFGLSLKSKHIMISIIKHNNNIKNAIYIGDTVFDKESAELSSTDFIQLTYGFGDTINAVINFRNFTNLHAYLLEIK